MAGFNCERATQAACHRLPASSAGGGGTPLGTGGWGASSRSRFGLIVAGVVILGACGIAGWLFQSGGYPLKYGRPCDPASSVGLAEILTPHPQAPTDRLVIRGRVGEVCRSVGCWFVLQEIKEGRLYEVFVDLKKDGTFTVPADASGREAVVSGKLVGTPPDVTFEADGVRLR